MYVLDDGGEADLDLGNYERYLDVTLGRDNNITTGKVYQHVIEREVGGPSRGPNGINAGVAQGGLPWKDCSDHPSLDQRYPRVD